LEYFIEGVLELLFSIAKKKPEKKPDIELKNKFIVYYNKTLSAITLLVLFLGGILFSIFSFFVDSDTRILFYIFVALFFILFLLFLFLFSIRYNVSSEQIRIISCFFFKKEIMWNDISCVRTIEKEDDSNLIIALYNQDGNCVADISTDMENAWYIVEMAQHKNIEIREEKDLTIKQIKKL